MIDWNDLKYCAHVVRSGTTLGAAKVLNTSQTTVMRRISALEAGLGFALFEKRRSGYQPTDALKELLPLLDTVEKAHQEFAHAASQTGRSLKGTIRVTASELLVTLLLAPLLAEFSSEYPEIRIELFTSDAYIDLNTGAADIALRATPAPSEPSLFGRRIVDHDRWSLCCTQAYASRYGRPANFDDLINHKIIALIDGIFPTPLSEWVDQRIPQQNIVARHNSLISIYMAMKSSIGISLCPDVLSVMDPDLVRCLPVPVGSGRELWVLSPERLRRNKPVRTLMDFIATRLTSNIRKAFAAAGM